MAHPECSHPVQRSFTPTLGGYRVALAYLLAEDIHQLVAQLGFKQIFLVGHDVGSQPAYSYAAAHPTEVKRLVIMEYIFPGFTPPQLEGKIWWFPFHQTPDIPEALVDGKERMYLSWFYHNIAYNPSAITQADIDEFVSHYSAPGGMRDGFNYFRAFPEDASTGSRSRIYSSVWR